MTRHHTIIKTHQFFLKQLKQKIEHTSPNVLHDNRRIILKVYNGT